MRTTLDLSNDALALARTYAKARALRLREAVSDLILRAGTTCDARPAVIRRNGVWVLSLGEDAPVLKSAKVKNLLDTRA